MRSYHRNICRKYGHLTIEMNTALFAPGDYVEMSALMLYNGRKICAKEITRRMDSVQGYSK